MRTRGIMLALCVAALVARAHRAEAQTSPRAIIERGIEAMGGANRIDAVNAGTTQMKGTMYEGKNSLDFTEETFFQRPDRYKGIMHVQSGNQKLDITVIFNGDKGWIKSGAGSVRPFGEKAIAEFHEELYSDRVQRLTPLLAGDFQLAMLSPIKVDRKTAVGIHVTSRGHRPVDIYFDPDTGLPVEIVRRATDFADGKEYTQARIFSDYRTIEGVKTATKVAIYKDGKKHMVQEAVKVKYLPSLDASVFAKP